jgi:hypothetical protein
MHPARRHHPQRHRGRLGYILERSLPLSSLSHLLLNGPFHSLASAPGLVSLAQSLCPLYCLVLSSFYNFSAQLLKVDPSATVPSRLIPGTLIVHSFPHISLSSVDLSVPFHST